MLEQNNLICQIYEKDFLKDKKIPIPQLLDEYNEQNDFYNEKEIKHNLSSIIENVLQSQSKNKSKIIIPLPIDLIRNESQNNDDKGETKCYTGFEEKEGIQDNYDNENPDNQIEYIIFSQEKKVKHKSNPIFPIPTNLIRNEETNDDEIPTNDTKSNYEEEEDNKNNGYNNSNEKKPLIIIYPEKEKKDNNRISNQNYSSNEKNSLFKVNNNIKEDDNKNKELKNSSNIISKDKNKNNRAKKGPIIEF